MESKNAKAILSALSFFEIFNYPLTRSELFNYLLFDDINVFPLPEKVGISWAEFNIIINDLLKQGIIVDDDGLYHLKSQPSGHALSSRLKYEATFHSKIKRARLVTFFIAMFPGVRAVATVNSVGFKFPSDEADIDFLIITDKKSLYLSRLLITFFLKIFGLRPTKNKQKNKICTSFWLSEESLNLEKIAYTDNDVYLYYWLLNVYPLYDQKNYWERWQSANFWLKRRLPNSNFRDNIKKIHLGFVARAWKALGELFFNYSFWNVLAKKLQHRFFSKEIKDLMNKDTRVIVNDEMLKFHTVDNRQKYFDLYQENLKDSLNKHQYVAKEN
ncbi:MAG TPA: hypothetical protein PL066_00120 [bacterium]|nr:hypothetical protein [bacterium]